MEVENLVRELCEKGLTLATAESCTGGGIGQAITAIPGSSSVFLGGIISYSNQMKKDLLGVQEKTLIEFGAVSEECAQEMAQGIRSSTGCDIGISVTGIAGPGSDGVKPEGRVCFALNSSNFSSSNTIEFGAIGRENVRESSISYALKTVSRHLQNL